MDFSSGQWDNNILLEFTQDTFKLRSNLVRDSNSASDFNTDPTENNEWIHVALTVEGATRKHFVNGILNGTKTGFDSLNYHIILYF